MSKISTFQEYDDFIKEITTHYKVADPSHRLELVTFGLLEEAGEVASKMKRKYREGDFDVHDIAKELGDVLGYLTSICHEIGISLESVVNANQEKLLSRKENKTLLGSGDHR